MNVAKIFGISFYVSTLSAIIIKNNICESAGQPSLKRSVSAWPIAFTCRHYNAAQSNVVIASIIVNRKLHTGCRIYNTNVNNDYDKEVITNVTRRRALECHTKYSAACDSTLFLQLSLPRSGHK